MITTETISDLCRQFLSPVVAYLDDPDVTDIWVNGNGTVFIERSGVKKRVDCLISEDLLLVACVQIGRLVCHAEINREQPILDARLPDGSRVNAVLSPVSQPGTQLAIRKHYMRRYSLAALTEMGSVPRVIACHLNQAVLGRHSILISGGTGSGKTTLLNALLDLIPEDERLCIVEDTAELQVQARNVARFEERKEQRKTAAVTMRDLVRSTLRQKPDRIIVGEVRGGEAYDLVTAMSTGHDGSISTIHANNALGALDRLVTYCLQARDVSSLPETTVRRLVAGSLQYVVHLGRDKCVREFIQVEGVSGDQFVVKGASWRVGE